MWWIETSTSRLPRAPPIFCTRSLCRPAVSKAICRPAISCSLLRWRAGAPSNGPSSITRGAARRLASELGIPLVLNGPPGSGFQHLSSLPGPIYATRRAAAVVGVDSGPLHLAAALGKPGVAIFGPTDPRAQRPLWRFDEGASQRRRYHDLQAWHQHRRGHAANLSGSGFRNPQGAACRAPPPCWKHGLMLQFPKPYADRVARLRVPSGFLLVAVFAWFSRPTPQSLAYGLPVSLLGLAIRAWAARLSREESATGHRRPLRPHPQSALYRNPAGSRRSGHRVPQRWPWRFVRVRFHFRLHACDPVGRTAPARHFSRLCCLCRTSPRPVAASHRGTAGNR